MNVCVSVDLMFVYVFLLASLFVCLFLYLCSSFCVCVCVCWIPGSCQMQIQKSSKNATFHQIRIELFILLLLRLRRNLFSSLSRIRHKSQKVQGRFVFHIFRFKQNFAAKIFSPFSKILLFKFLIRLCKVDAKLVPHASFSPSPSMYLYASFG